MPGMPIQSPLQAGSEHLPLGVGRTSYFSVDVKDPPPHDTRTHSRWRYHAALVGIFAAVACMVLLLTSRPEAPALSGLSLSLFTPKPMLRPTSVSRHIFPNTLSQKRAYPKMVSSMGLPKRNAPRQVLTRATTDDPSNKWAFSFDEAKDEVEVANHLLSIRDRISALQKATYEALKMDRLESHRLFSEKLAEALIMDPQWALDHNRKLIEEAIHNEDYDTATRLRQEASSIKKNLPQYQLGGKWVMKVHHRKKDNIAKVSKFAVNLLVLDGWLIGRRDGDPPIMFRFDLERINEKELDQQHFIAHGLGRWTGECTIGLAEPGEDIGATMHLDMLGMTIVFQSPQSKFIQVSLSRLAEGEDFDEPEATTPQTLPASDPNADPRLRWLHLRWDMKQAIKEERYVDAQRLQDTSAAFHHALEQYKLGGLWTALLPARFGLGLANLTIENDYLIGSLIEPWMAKATFKIDLDPMRKPRAVGPPQSAELIPEYFFDGTCNASKSLLNLVGSPVAESGLSMVNDVPLKMRVMTKNGEGDGFVLQIDVPSMDGFPEFKLLTRFARPDDERLERFRVKPGPPLSANQWKSAMPELAERIKQLKDKEDPGQA